MLSEPVLTVRAEGGRDVPLLVWRAATGLPAVSSAPLGGGLGRRHWVLNATVPMSYDRDDPDRHLAELAAGLDLSGPGIGHLTGVDVAEVVPAAEAGVRVWATVGLGSPIWAAGTDGTPKGQPRPAGPSPSPSSPSPSSPSPSSPSPSSPSSSPSVRRAGSGDASAPGRPAPVAPRVGTVNIVALVPARLSAAALVNAVATATEAKAQALWELGLPATGTATDAVTVLCAPDGPVEAYGGPRSRYGAPLARAVHRAVRAGGAASTLPWSDRPATGDRDGRAD
ncbi:adenosylcobinamide amidohydrolase [Plantactinospora sp. KBS50]|uniref:adenosylcobinamide amidohydrolase n=1 Tax=Plantactinospora sp. KBS50 TaxID=2024580 RepID=UPI000BAAC7A9|nr:adenosylcobinamide amidohydrolase [Plantactinospora sp. KBS50]ASW57040.1 adenosylcobinamide amidohydrolase [Plantactinospora sp. KBS50]